MLVLVLGEGDVEVENDSDGVVDVDVEQKEFTCLYTSFPTVREAEWDVSGWKKDESVEKIRE